MRRISFMIDDKIEKAVKELEPTVNLDQFLRTAVHFYLDYFESIKNIEARVSQIEKSISQPALTNENTDAEQEQKAYKRSKAIWRILNMGKESLENENS